MSTQETLARPPLPAFPRPSVRCGFINESRRCGNPPAYRVELADCEVCLIGHGWLFCAGHRACLAHAAELRAEEYRFAGDGLPCGDLSVTRIHDIEIKEAASA